MPRPMPEVDPVTIAALPLSVIARFSRLFLLRSEAATTAGVKAASVRKSLETPRAAAACTETAHDARERGRAAHHPSHFLARWPCRVIAGRVVDWERLEGGDAGSRRWRPRLGPTWPRACRGRTRSSAKVWLSLWRPPWTCVTST